MNVSIVGLIVRPGRTDAMEYTKRLREYLAAESILTVTDDDIMRNVNEGRVPDLLIALGGDGTLLRAAGLGAELNIPVIGFNFGRMGFLTEENLVEPDMLLNMLRNDTYVPDNRMILDVTTEDDGKAYKAMNDVILSRGGYARLITVEAEVNNEVIGRYTADGLIISTPTGSTGYSLSAGGPIVSPEMNCFIITPICAHSLRHRPIVISADSTVRLRLFGDHEQTALLQIDGQSVRPIRNGSETEIKWNGGSVNLIRKEKTEFFRLVDRKLTEWGNR